MEWHKRYLQQASWTRELRRYLMQKAGIDRAARLLEVGCGTGAVLLDTLPAAVASKGLPFALHGLDISASVLVECASHVPEARLTRADALALPYASAIFDITFCHFLLLWVRDPVQALDEMRRVTRRGGHVIAMAEPDYSERVDQPEALSVLGIWQARALQQQGANTSIGSHLAELVRRAGLQIVEAGSMAQWYAPDLTDLELKGEWDVLREDLHDALSAPELDRLMRMDAEARQQGQRVLHVPTYFALAQV